MFKMFMKEGCPKHGGLHTMLPLYLPSTTWTKDLEKRKTNKHCLGIFWLGWEVRQCLSPQSVVKEHDTSQQHAIVVGNCLLHSLI